MCSKLRLKGAKSLLPVDVRHSETPYFLIQRAGSYPNYLKLRTASSNLVNFTTR